MAEVLVQFEDVVTARDGRTFTPRACGADVDGLWQGWIEFVGAEQNDVLRTSRETTQPNRNDLLYWAQGLTHVYLEGALRRALEPTPVLSPREREVDVEPAFDRPADESSARRRSGGFAPVRTILDPFEVYRQGERVLRQELGALDIGHLRDIARAHQLVQDLQRMRAGALIDAIVEGTRQRLEDVQGDSSRAEAQTSSGRPEGSRG
jgi:hypothetical protein